MLFQFVSVLLLIGSDAAAIVNRKRSNLLQHKSTNNKQHQLQQHDERYAAYIGLAEEDNVTNNRQLQNSMSMSSIPAEVTSWTKEEADGPQHSDVLWTDPNEVAWKEDVDSGSADGVIDDTLSGYIGLSYASLCIVGLAALPSELFI